MIYSNILKNPLISGQRGRGEDAKALPAFHQLPCHSFIPAMLIMVLRLVLDVLTKLLIWQKGGGGCWAGLEDSCLRELLREKMKRENFQCGCLGDERGANSGRNFNNIFV